MIVVVTSCARSGDGAKALAAGADACITRPFSPRQLSAKLRELMAEHRDDPSRPHL
jgi:two-component system cell cycle response regulator DivK